MRRSVYLFVLASLIMSCNAMAQGPGQHFTLDSGSVVRLRWADRRPIKATLLAPLTPSTDTVRFCRYPSTACGAGSLNPLKSLSTQGLAGVELRRHRRPGRGMLLGAGIGVIFGGFAAAMVSGLSDTRVSTCRQVAAIASVTVSWAGIGLLLDLTGDRWVPQ